MDLKLDALAEWYAEKSSDLLRGFRQEARGILEEIGRQVRTIRKSGEELGSLAKSAIAPDAERRYAERLSEKILGAPPQVELPDQLSYDHVAKLYDELLRAVGTVTDAGRVYVPRLGSAFKSQIVELDYTLKRLAVNVDKLNKVLIKNRAQAQQIDAANRRIQRLIDDASSLETLRAQMSDLTQRISRVEKGIDEAKSAAKRLQEESWFKDLSKAERSVEETEAQFSRFFSQLSKPLRKMQRMSYDGQIGLTETYRQVLSELIESPVEFLAKSELLDLNPIFHKMQELLESGKLKIEARKERRATEAIEQFRNGLLDKLRGEYAQAVGELNALEKRLSEMGLGRQLELLHKSSKKMESDLAKLRLERHGVEQRINELEKGVREAVRAIQAALSKLFGDEYSISRG